MRCRRLVACVAIGVGLAALAGCTDSTSPAARAWERSAAVARSRPAAYPTGALAATDGVGRSIFTAGTELDTTHGRSAYANVPTE